MKREVILILAILVPTATAATPAERTEAVKVVEEMIEAHGGMVKWRSAPTVTFEDQWRADGKRMGGPVRITVEQTTRRTYHDYLGTDTRLAWDGTKAWSENWESQAPPRFLALLNYYFVNLPWLTMDDGVNLSDVGTATLRDDPTEYVTVRMTFEPGVGDTPDDYYVLYIHPQTKQLKGCRYVVTYKALLPEGEKMTPEHVLVFDSYERVDGLLVPTHFSIYQVDGTPYAECEITNWSFHEPFDESRMTMPPGAVVDESQP
jgi:hypothetical protein